MVLVCSCTGIDLLRCVYVYAYVSEPRTYFPTCRQKMRGFRLLFLTLVIRTSLLFFAILSHKVLDDYDLSTAMTMREMQQAPHSFLENDPKEDNVSGDVPALSYVDLLAHTFNWDSVFFTDIAHREQHMRLNYEKNQTVSSRCKVSVSTLHNFCSHYTAPYPFVHYFAFYPGYPALLSRLCSFTSWFPICALGLNIGMYFLSALGLFKLTSLIFHSEPMSDLSTLFYLLSPAGIFTQAAYCDVMYACLSNWGCYFLLLCWEAYFHRSTRRPPNKWRKPVQYSIFASAATLCFLGASTIRSNGMLNVLYFFYGGYLIGTETLYCFFRCRKHTFQKWKELLSGTTAMIVMGVCAAITTIPFFLFQYCAQRECCPTDDLVNYNSTVFGKDDSHMPCGVPFYAFYSSIQSQYWNVGFLSQFQYSQLLNLVIALPTLFVVVWGLKRKGLSLPLNPIILLWNSVWRIEKSSIPNRVVIKNQAHLISEKDVEQHYHLACNLMLLVNTAIALFLVHFQVIPRFLFSLPSVQWILSNLYIGSPPRARHVLFSYLLLWNILGIVLHSNFYPWT